MTPLASNSFQTEYIKEPLQISVTLDSITFAEGGGQQSQTLFVSAKDGPDTVAYNAGMQVSVSSPPSGIALSYGPASNGRFAMTVTYTGKVPVVTADITLTITAKGMTVERTIHISTARKGADGEKGGRGAYIPTPQLWEDYPDGYSFMSGADNEERLDVALIQTAADKLIPYSCKVSHVKTGDSLPPDEDTVHWSPSDIGEYNFIATQLLLARSARIEFLSGQSIRVGEGLDISGYFGAPLSGGEILYTGGGSTRAATFVVYDTGRARWGKSAGQRIEINPLLAAMRIFDPDGDLRTTVQGEPKDWTTAIPGGGADTDFSGTSSFVATSTGTHTVIAANTAVSDGAARIEVPAMTLYAKCNDTSGSASEMSPTTNVSAVVTVWVGSTVADQRSYSCQASRRTQGGVAGGGSGTLGENTVLTDEAVLSVAVKKNDVVKVTVDVSVSMSGGTGSGGVGRVTSGAFGGKFVYSGVQCVYATNGICLSSNSDNYFFALFDNAGTLHFGCRANGAQIIPVT